VSCNSKIWRCRRILQSLTAPRACPGAGPAASPSPRLENHLPAPAEARNGAYNTWSNHFRRQKCTAPTHSQGTCTDLVTQSDARKLGSRCRARNRFSQGSRLFGVADGADARGRGGHLAQGGQKTLPAAMRTIQRHLSLAATYRDSAGALRASSEVSCRVGTAAAAVAAVAAGWDNASGPASSCCPVCEPLQPL